MSEFQDNTPLIPTVYATESGFIAISLDQEHQGVWATAQNIADIFGVPRQNVEHHISNIYKNGELDKNQTCKYYLLARDEGDRRISKEVAHYDLDVILAVGYGINSKKAADFRRWSSGVLKDHIEKGYSLNYSRLESDQEALRNLASEVRALRTSEKSTYAILRDCFRICASDYDGDSQSARSFFALLQDKFYHAITKMTGSKIILDRARSEEINAGIVSFNAEIPTIEEMLIAKNYFNSKELQELNLLSEAFLVMAESLISRGVRMTMDDLHKKIDETMRLLEYDVFGGYQNYTRDEANAHARREHAYYLEILRLQMLDWSAEPFSLDSFYNGEYDYLKEETSKITLPQLKKNLPLITEKLHLMNEKFRLEFL